MKNKNIGKMGENYAAHFLLAQNYEILKSNFRCYYGELDIIAMKDNEIVGVEVKTRRNLDFDFAEETISKRKLTHLVQSLDCFCLNNNFFSQNLRLDLIFILLNKKNMLKLIEQFNLNF